MNGDSEIINHLPEIFSEIKHDCYKAVGAGIVCYLTYRLFRYISIRNYVKKIREANRQSLSKQSERIKTLVENCGVSREELDRISSLGWEDLVSKLQAGELTATVVLRAYQAACLDIHNRTNSIVCWLDCAETSVSKLDELPADQRGPLHGVPVSVKECYDVAGTFSTSGMTIFARNFAKTDCPLVQMIRNLGGVPFCKTNVPQCMFSLQCSNPVYGTSCNPHSKDGNPRECGGSSGGEGVLVGGGGSILGLGSDIGGSLRSPVAFCGGYSLKPTASRHLSQLGVAAPMDAAPIGVLITGGYMTRSAVALEQAWRITWGLEDGLNSQRHDPVIIPPVWRQDRYDQKITIGYFTEPGWLSPASGCVRAVKEAKQRLEASGYKVVPFNPPDINKVFYYFNGMVLADKNEMMYQNLKNDVTDSTLNGMVGAMAIYKLPWIIQKLFIHPLASLLTRIPPILKLFTKTPELMHAIEEKNKFVRDYMEKMEEAGVDVILCPGQMLPAPPTGKLGEMVAGIISYIPWNVLNFAAGIAPITKWTNEDTKQMENYPRDDMFARMIASYCDKGAEGMPLSVQVVAKPHLDEQVLRVLSDLEKHQ